MFYPKDIHSKSLFCTNETVCKEPILSASPFSLSSGCEDRTHILPHCVYDYSCSKRSAADWCTVWPHNQGGGRFEVPRRWGIILAHRIMCNISKGRHRLRCISFKRCSSCPHLLRNIPQLRGNSNDTSISSNDKSKYETYTCSYNKVIAYFQVRINYCPVIVLLLEKTNDKFHAVFSLQS